MLADRDSGIAPRERSLPLIVLWLRVGEPQGRWRNIEHIRFTLLM
jgi:hypothetical protein